MLSVQLHESKSREVKQKEMYESVMNAFQHSSMGPSEAAVEKNNVITDELIAESITKNHPKVKDIVAEACLTLQDRMHSQKE